MPGSAGASGNFGDEDFRANTTFWGGLLGFGLTAGILYFLREYILYVVKAGHIAVMVELLDGRPMPEGRGQITHARDMVDRALRRDQRAVRHRPARQGRARRA